jgi:hypothetical protein
LTDSGGLGLHIASVRVEAVLLTILVFAGVNVAWLLLFDETPSDRASLAQGIQASLPHHSSGSQGKPAAEGNHGAQSPL